MRRTPTQPVLRAHLVKDSAAMAVRAVQMRPLRTLL